MANPIWAFWAKNYRNVRALGAAAAMLIAILAMSSLRCNPMVSKENISGVVLEIEDEGLHPFGEVEAQSRILIATPDSTKVRILIPPPVPIIGDVIPMVRENYKKGNAMYYLDQVKWRMEGPK